MGRKRPIGFGGRLGITFALLAAAFVHQAHAASIAAAAGESQDGGEKRLIG